MKSFGVAFLSSLLIGLVALGSASQRNRPLPSIQQGVRGVVAVEQPLRMVNYYPTEYAREQFWPNWSAASAAMATDLDRIATLGGNTVRIALYPSSFDYPQPASDELTKLDEALGLIAAHGLRAHVTLFGCWFSWDDVDGSRAWLSAVVGPHSNDPRIAIFELYNEIPLDQPATRSWLQQLLPELKRAAGAVPVTVSVNRVEWLGDVRELMGPTPPDIYTLHWYPSGTTGTEALAPALARARELIEGADLYLAEVGSNTFTQSEESQAELFEDVFHDVQAFGIKHFGVWTLYDFTETTTGCSGSATPVGDNYYGIYRRDGTPKPAAAVVQAAFHDVPFTQPPAPRVLNSSFEATNPYTGVVEDWRSWDVDWSGVPRFAHDCTVALTGRCSALVEGVPGAQVGLYTARLLPIAPGRRYSAQGFVRVDQLVGFAQLTLSWFDASSRWLGVDAASPPVTSADGPGWVPVQVPAITPPDEAAYVQIYARITANPPIARAWFDDIAIEVQD